MPNYFDEDRELSKSLQSLLLLHPSEVEIQKRVVLTTTPYPWRGAELGGDTLILDLSALLGLRISPWRMSATEMVEELVKRFLECGWRAEQIIPEYRPDFRSRGEIDIAVLDEDKTLILAVEAKRSIHLSPTVVQGAFQQLSSLAKAKWQCVTDGKEFHVRNARTGEQHVTQQVPTPSDFGLISTGREKVKSYSKQPTVIHPATPEELQSAVFQHQPQAVVLDNNLPFGMVADKRSTSQSAMDFLRALLPENILPKGGRVEVLHILMAWAGSIESVRILSGIAPSSLMRARAYEWLRQYLHNRLRLCGIVELPVDLYRQAVITTTLFYLGGNRDRAYFDVLSSRGDLIDIESRPWFDSLSKWMKGKEPTTGYTANVNKQTLWAVGPNDPELERIYERLGRIGELISLGELCEVRRSLRVGRVEEVPEHGIPYLEGRSIRDGSINFEEARMVRADNIPERNFLRNGDMLLSLIASERSSVVLNQSNAPAVASPNLIILRPRGDRVSAEYLLEYLNSSTAKKLILANASKLGGLHRISPATLRELMVPLVEPELFHGLNETKAIEAELHSKADELESSRRSLFDSENGQIFRDKVSNLKRGGKVLARSVQSAGRLDFQIANFYPFPIAYSFRLLASIVNPAELYKEQLRVAENLLAFLALVSLSLLQKKDLAEAGINLRDYWQGGISPGDWKAITARSSKIFATYKDVPLAAAIQRLNIGSEKKGFGVTAKFLVEALNNFKHHRGPAVEEDYVRASKEVEAALIDAMEKIAFFTEYPIRQVQDINARRRSEKVDLRCLRYTGDHPGLPQEQVVFDRPLTKGDLFIDLGRNNWVLLYPFITSMNCTTCKTRETYLIDKWDESRGIAYVKSFERGHSESKKDIAEALQDFLAA
jgi:hypothetical protein